MRKIRFIIAAIVGISALSTYANSLPLWVEQDSITAIDYRIQRDFSVKLDSGLLEIRSLYPNIDIPNANEIIQKHYIEVKSIKGELMMHRKSIRNFGLLTSSINNENWQGRGANPDKEDIAMVKEILAETKGNGSICSGKRIKYKFSIDVPKYEFLLGDTLSVWMPVPLETARQKNVNIISVSQHDYIQSNKANTCHNTLYFNKPITSECDSVIHFEYIGEFETYAQYFAPEYILENIKPYDKQSELYKHYTDLSHKHIINLDSLAQSIVGLETNPYLQSELIYDYISKTFPWAGAREYSTIECIPKYVLDEKHGDCGQVSLLYISLMRSLGVPAKWESGWMLHPWSKNLHDWAEVYFEGIGWVPVDVSFGRYVNCNNKREINYYSTGMDNYRFATNNGICSPLYPPKKFTRSETIDFQLGEVECSKGNLFYPGWKKKLEVLSITDIND